VDVCVVYTAHVTLYFYLRVTVFARALQ